VPAGALKDLQKQENYAILAIKHAKKKKLGG
jgi:hypothetical protein